MKAIFVVQNSDRSTNQITANFDHFHQQWVLLREYERKIDQKRRVMVNKSMCREVWEVEGRSVHTLLINVFSLYCRLKIIFGSTGIRYKIVLLLVRAYIF